ncbi:hypothetical protein FHW89_005509 [Mucilaginibacter sp. SG564]|nr:hypothetical protein [Mucilaginibacter sp. SG564]
MLWQLVAWFKKYIFNLLCYRGLSARGKHGFSFQLKLKLKALIMPPTRYAALISRERKVSRIEFATHVIARRNDVAIPNYTERLCLSGIATLSLAMTRVFRMA